jgi:Coenzyme PQQ synthesis protein D (PqqD)
MSAPSAANRANFSPKKYVARSAQIASRVLGDEVIIMSAKDSTLFTLNEVATVIWEAADGATPLDQIVSEKVCVQFDVTSETALRDAETLVRELAEHGILILSENPIEPPAVGEETP